MRVVPSQTNPVVEGVFQDNELSAIKYSHGKAAGLGWWIVLAGLGGFFLWASLAPLEKGVPLTGTVISSSSKKAIQHLTGGTVDAILVKEGDKIKKNDILVRMNRVQQNSNTEMVRGQYLAARISEARLMAEQDGKGRLVLPAALKDSRTDPRVQASLSVQQQLLTSRQAGLRQEMVANQSNIRGLILQGKGLEESLIGKRQRLVFMEEQLTGLRVLAGEGYVARNRLLDVEQSFAQGQAALAEDGGNIGRIQQQIAETEARSAQRRRAYQSEVSDLLSNQKKEADSLEQRLQGLDYELANSSVTSPVDGTVVGIMVFTQGGVVAPGATLMSIVPSGDELIVEAMIPVHLIDKVRVGMPVELIFSGINQAVTPRVPAIATQISADRFIEERSGAPFYKMKVKVVPEGLNKVASLEIKPGMNVDLFVQTGARTLMNYLLKPLYDHLTMSMSET